MKNISTPVDFTETSKIAIKYACNIAAKAGAKIQLLHVIEPDQKQDNKQQLPNAEAVKEKLREFSGIDAMCNTEYEIIVETGNFAKQIPALLKEHQSDLVLIATHGVKGIFQTMQGAEVLKLIQNIGVPSLVLQAHTAESFAGFKKILFPIASHSNFQIKMKQTTALADIYGSKVLVYVFYPEKGELDELLESNLKKTSEFFTEKKIDFEIIKEPSKVYGIGYARQAMEYAEKADIELFAVMAHASSEHSYFGNVERTEFILNKKGIPVLCCSE